MPSMQDPGSGLWQWARARRRAACHRSTVAAHSGQRPRACQAVGAAGRGSDNGTAVGGPQPACVKTSRGGPRPGFEDRGSTGTRDSDFEAPVVRRGRWRSNWSKASKYREEKIATLTRVTAARFELAPAKSQAEEHTRKQVSRFVCLFRCVRPVKM